MGKRIGFVRFSRIHNVDQMIKHLCDVWFGYHKMFASISHLWKTDTFVSTHVVRSKVEKQENHLNLYASVLKGTSKEVKGKEQLEDVIEILFGDFIVEKRTLACLVEARYFHMLHNICMLCFDGGC